MIGTSLCVGDIPEPALITEAIARALGKSHARRQTDQIAALLLLMSSHWSRHAVEVCQTAMRESRTLQIWGGVCKGVVVDGRIEHQRPAIGVAVIPERPERLHKARLNLTLGPHEPALTPTEGSGQAANDDNEAHDLGLLSYGLHNEAYPTVQHGHVRNEENSLLAIQAHRIQTFDSLGLEMLCDWQTVDKAIGPLLQKVTGKAAAKALACPSRNTQPVALRLGVQRLGRTDWIPIIEIYADGTLHLAETVNPGESVCLAARTADCARREVQGWHDHLTPAFRSSTRRLILMAGGMERSTLCHNDDPEWEVLRQQWPDTPMIGALGQAAWVRSPDLPRDRHTTALNHRLAAGFLLF